MDLTETTSMLARTPEVLRALLAGVSPAWLHHDDGPGTWSAYDIVGHLSHGDATNWLPRIQMILEHGARRAFEPFDREAMLARERQPGEALLAEFAAARQESMVQLASLGLGPGDLDRPGRHPQFGDVTLGQLLAAWVAHDLTHLAQVGEVLSRRYREDVGPWRAFLPALDRVAAAE